MSCVNSCACGYHNLNVAVGHFGMHETVKKEMAAFDAGKSGQGLAYAMAGRGKALINLPFSMLRLVGGIQGAARHSALAIALCPCTVCLSELGADEEEIGRSDGKKAFFSACIAAFEMASLPGSIVAILSPEVSTLHMKSHKLQKLSTLAQIEVSDMEKNPHVYFDEESLRIRCT